MSSREGQFAGSRSRGTLILRGGTAIAKKIIKFHGLELSRSLSGVKRVQDTGCGIAGVEAANFPVCLRRRDFCAVGSILADRRNTDRQPSQRCIDSDFHGLRGVTEDRRLAKWGCRGRGWMRALWSSAASRVAALGIVPIVRNLISRSSHP